jgi:3-phenylpropionate/trans-cinnamate dioxygenase ferredoxin subunit
MEERICSVHDIEPGQARKFTLGNLDIAVVRIGDDWYAIGDTCTHQKVSLADGDVHADTLEIECCKHGSAFSLETGEPRSFPATKPEPVYQIRIDEDDVMLVLP